MTSLPQSMPVAQNEICPDCGKPRTLCLCAAAKPIANRIELLILQHPQEQDRLLGTARLTARHLQRATLKIGLSWPTLAKALGRPVDPKRWGVLYLGSLTAASLPHERDIVALDTKGTALADQAAVLAEIDGVVVLDGSWSQAKTLWWRNPWVLKCRRLALNPKQRSRYGKFRREPRREGLSSLEAASLALARLGHQPEIETALLALFSELLRRYRAFTLVS
ncbi:MAG TPA: tRNA-uridine aminocarboxypropyltransferase [Stellaceae bacterium]|nr:tRNA-uridine aminocarboxypropyltransferase [Stellaceae bacterium]